MYRYELSEIIRVLSTLICLNVSFLCPLPFFLIPSFLSVFFLFFSFFFCLSLFFKCLIICHVSFCISSGVLLYSKSLFLSGVCFILFLSVVVNMHQRCILKVAKDPEGKCVQKSCLYKFCSLIQMAPFKVQRKVICF